MSASLRSRAALAAGLLLAAVVFTWPLVLHPTSRLAATEVGGDPYLNLWILGWDLRTISVHPGWLVDGRVFDANIFFPARGTLAYSDHGILQALAVWPLYAATHDLVLCYNMLFAASLVLGAWSMFAFVRFVTGRTVPALIAGLVWGFSPFHFTHLSHIQLQALYWMPLTFLLLYRLTIAPTVGNAVGLGVLIALQTISSIYLGLIGAVGLAVAAIALYLRTGRWRHTRAVTAIAAAAVVAAIGSVPGVLPYWLAQRREGFTRNLTDASHHSAVLASYVQAPVENLIYGRTGFLRPPAGGGGPLSRRDGPEQALFPGFLVLALAAIGLVRARSVSARPLATTVAIVAFVGLLLSLGPDGVRPIYSALFHWVFGFHAIRAPARFAVLVIFGLAVLAGLGVAAVTERRGRTFTNALVTAAVLIISAEFLNGSIPWDSAPQLTTATGRWLASAQEPGAVIYLPLAADTQNTIAMLASLEHGRPIVNGYSGHRPAFFSAMVDAMSGFPGAPALLALRDIGVRFVVSPTAVPTGEASPLVERARFDDGVVYELRWTPESENLTAAAADGPEPPPPGAVGFAPEETATYRCRWLSGPLTVPAGEAVVSAQKTNRGFDFVVRVRTAEWVRSFFDADDTFETEADSALMPTAHRQTLNEGRRHITRSVGFDRAARRLTVATGDEPALTMPLSRWARDPLAALFYARTLPLTPGTRYTIPMTEAGRETTIELFVRGAETIRIDDREVDALKIEPRVIARVAVKRPLRGSVWVSHDARRIPLAIQIETEFGRFAAELVDSAPR